MITAIHINSTAPFKIKNRGEPYEIEDFELLSTVLSALMWRKKNGKIKLYTDQTAFEYYDSLGITDLWNGGIDKEILENIPDSINQEIFWAAAKIFAFRNEKTPVAMIDTDLIVWENIGKYLKSEKIAVIHREYIHDYYLPQEMLKIPEGYKFDEEWDWNELPCNMAFAYISDSEYKDKYTSEAIKFMTNNNEYPDNMISQMIFAEQRTISMVAKKMGIPIFHFLDDPFQTDNTIFSHIWGAKDIARNMPGQRKLLCISLKKKIEELFPEYYEKIENLSFVRLS